jgi:hypothetical protein
MTPTIHPSGEGVTFPRHEGGRPTTPVSRGILADAAAAADPQLAERITACRAWRTEYAGLVRDVTAASAGPADRARAIALTGLTSMRDRMVVEHDGEDLPLREVFGLRAGRPLTTRRVEGAAAPVTELRVPYRGGELHGATLRARLDRWVQQGVVEPSFARAIERVIEHPEWLSLPGRKVALIGAGAEIGPLERLSAWGASTIAIDLPSPAIWDRIETLAHQGAGRVEMPISPGGERGFDLLRALPETRDWLHEVAAGHQLVLAMHAYADGGLHVRLTAAADALAEDLLRARPDTALAGLGTPTDAFVVPDEVVETARAAYAGRGLRRFAQAPLQRGSGGRLFSPAYADGTPVADVLVTQQGPNYALAKRLQRWGAMAAQTAGHAVSFNVAPATWTRSVTKNRTLAAAYAGAHRFGVEVFDADTTRVLMAALLVHDLHQPATAPEHPEALFGDQAAHGGLWRSAYTPRSVLGLAALSGLPSTVLKRAGRA